MAFTVIYDACVLYPNTLRDLLIRIAQSGLVHAKWTNKIVDEVFENLRKNRPDLPTGALDRTRKLMTSAVPDWSVSNYEPLIAALDLPDAGDRHVLAAAIRARAQVIVTNNVRDFPESALSCWDVEAKRADDFVVDQLGLNATVVWACVQQIAHSWRNPPSTVGDVLASLERSGLLESVAPASRDVMARRHISPSKAADALRIVTTANRHGIDSLSTARTVNSPPVTFSLLAATVRPVGDHGTSISRLTSRVAEQPAAFVISFEEL